MRLYLSRNVWLLRATDNASGYFQHQFLRFLACHPIWARFLDRFRRILDLLGIRCSTDFGYHSLVVLLAALVHH